MSATITLRGFVATPPKFTATSKPAPDGTARTLEITSFRVGASDRRFNRVTGQWESGPVSWYSVSCFRKLALNVYASIHKGEPVVITGRLRVREWSAGDKSGLDVEVEAEAVGHDLTFGKERGFDRNPQSGSAGSGDDEHGEIQPSEPDDALSAAAAPLTPGWFSATSAEAGSPLTFPESADSAGPAEIDLDLGDEADDEATEVDESTGEVRAPF
ncbi:single-stranded DNA-binding protein [Gryllotalpicola ginsengisoli]|uniref:single-stranded DNA-binding protein n=1 Tax=Gryllotalpicola ginsengisoli TaxID=444608 RepID=UPI0003B36096|nr:single-stranded DNA-binding protein [Gryllotalpicola ginsengisoli]